MYATKLTIEQWTLNDGEWRMDEMEKNPIADAIIKQCPNLSDQLYDPMANRLSGADILRILCDKQCGQQKESGKHIKSCGTTIKYFYSKIQINNSLPINEFSSFFHRDRRLK